MNEKRRIVLRVGGKDVPLISADTPEYLRRLERYVDRQLNETAMAARMPVSGAAVLTAIGMGDDLLKAEDENQRLRRENAELHQRLDELSARAE